MRSDMTGPDNEQLTDATALENLVDELDEKVAAEREAADVPGKPSDDLAPGTLNSILKQAGLRRN